MFKKRSAPSRPTKLSIAKPTALPPVDEPLNKLAESGSDSDCDDSENAAEFMRRKRHKLSNKPDEEQSTESNNPSINLLVTVSSERSSLPDRASIADKHTIYAPKNDPNEQSGPSKLPTTAPQGSSKYGPLKVSGYARNITRFDYQPDICKDYLETGYCGYGDTCKFLHDRSDTKQSWQLDKEWDEKQKQKAKDTKEAALAEEIAKQPVVCAICHGTMVSPVQAACGHQYCESCALRRAATDLKCATCGKDTGGSFITVRTEAEFAKADNKSYSSVSLDRADRLAHADEQDVIDPFN